MVRTAQSDFCGKLKKIFKEQLWGSFEMEIHAAWIKPPLRTWKE